MVEAFIQVAPDAGGKNVRNISAQVLQPDGTTVTVYMQNVVLVDASGSPVDRGHPLMVEDQDTNKLLARAVELLEKISYQLGD